MDVYLSNILGDTHILKPNDRFIFSLMLVADASKSPLNITFPKLSLIEVVLVFMRVLFNVIRVCFLLKNNKQVNQHIRVICSYRITKLVNYSAVSNAVTYFDLGSLNLKITGYHSLLKSNKFT